MEKILISACLLGFKVRYHGGDSYCDHPLLKRWANEGRLVSVCPEVQAGASVPRSPSEIIGVGGGEAVLNRHTRIKNKAGIDVTDLYVKGAKIALDQAKEANIKIAILKESSPSCGSSLIYDGNFSGKQITQAGVTATLLRSNDIHVFDERQIELAEQYLSSIDAEYKR